MDAGIRGWNVLVTGASGGLGAAIVHAVAREGAGVGVHYHSGLERANAVVAELDARTELLHADLADEEHVDRMWDDAIRRFGRIDGIVVNAGIWIDVPTPLHEMTLSQWRRTLDVDLTSAFLTCRGFLRHLAAMPRAHAAVVLVGSTAALFGEAEHADYAAAKAGMIHGLLPSLKNEIVRLAPRGRVNAVAPGWTLTPMAERALAEPDDVVKQTRTVALRKVAQPDDVAAAVTFLLSPTLAGHISGAIVPVHGGMEGRVVHPCV